MIDSGDFAAFLAVVRHDGISAAASELHLSQSAVSHRIHALERALGVQLLRRGRGIRGVRLTQAGARLLPLADAWEELDRRITSISTGRTRFSIGAPNSATGLLAGAIDELMGLLDTVQLRLVTANHDQLMSSVERHVLDGALSPASHETDDLHSEVLGLEPYWIMTGEHSEDAAPGTISVRDLPAEQEIHIRWVGLVDWHESHWPGGRELAEVDSSHLLPALLTRSGGWSIVPRSTAVHLMAQHGFRGYELQEPAPQRTLHWITRRNEDQAIAPQIDLIRNRIAEMLRD